MQTGNSPSRAHRLVVTMLTTGVATLLAFAINFLLTPYITERLGVEAYGFITLANTFVSYAMIAMTALNSFSTRFIAVEYQRGDKKAASTYFTSLFFANAAVSLVIFLCMLPVIANIDGVLDVPARLVSDVQYLFVLVFVNFLVTNGSNSFSSAAYTKIDWIFTACSRSLRTLSRPPSSSLFMLFSMLTPTSMGLDCWLPVSFSSPAICAYIGG